ncbi:Hsp20/alpha crystallin family protein [Planctomicrobium sp. SH664]|uniref:Hsp20/alpha crystallin family protein n=1 Tax=Planctomicrobium sp. SH664 TaxID=3448125 RepID=UPI003F5BEF45
MSNSATTPDCTDKNQTPQVRPTRVRPAVDLLENDGDFVMYLDMPGATPDSIDVSLERNILTVKGTVNRSSPEGYRLLSGQSGPRSYERSFQLSDEVDRNGIDAEVTNGVLTLKFPKAQQARKSTIEVRGS